MGCQYPPYWGLSSLLYTLLINPSAGPKLKKSSSIYLCVALDLNTSSEPIEYSILWKLFIGPWKVLDYYIFFSSKIGFIFLLSLLI